MGGERSRPEAVARTQAAWGPHQEGEQASFRSLAAWGEQSPRRGSLPGPEGGVSLPTGGVKSPRRLGDVQQLSGNIPLFVLSWYLWKERRHGSSVRVHISL